jgi:hypothetical protein
MQQVARVPEKIAGHQCEALNRLLGATRRNEALKVVVVSPDAWELRNVFDRDVVDPDSFLRESITPVTALFGHPS